MQSTPIEGIRLIRRYAAKTYIHQQVADVWIDGESKKLMMCGYRSTSSAGVRGHVYMGHNICDVEIFSEKGSDGLLDHRSRDCPAFPELIDAPETDTTIDGLTLRVVFLNPLYRCPVCGKYSVGDPYLDIWPLYSWVGFWFINYDVITKSFESLLHNGTPIKNMVFRRCPKCKKNKLTRMSLARRDVERFRTKNRVYELMSYQRDRDRRDRAEKIWVDGVGALARFAGNRYGDEYARMVIDLCGIGIKKGRRADAKKSAFRKFRRVMRRITEQEVAFFTTLLGAGKIKEMMIQKERCRE